MEAAKSMEERKNLVFPIDAPDGTQIFPKRQWLWGRDRVSAAKTKGELEFTKTSDSWSVNIKQYLKDENGKQRETKAFSIIEGIYSQHGTSELVGFLTEPQVFQFPKPSTLIKQLLTVGTSGGEAEIVLDFFAGSCPTSQAVWQLNREDGGHRQFILVQIPEPTALGSPSQNAGYQTISEIGKERMRRVISKMNTEQLLELRSTLEDLGFKVFKLATSHFKTWRDYEGDDLKAIQNLFDEQETPLVDDWTPDGLRTEILLMEGFPLASNVEGQPKFADNAISVVSSGACGHRLWICLDRKIHESTLAKLKLPSEDRFICLDSAIDDNTKLRLTQDGVLKTI